METDHPVCVTLVQTQSLVITAAQIDLSAFSDYMWKAQFNYRNFRSHIFVSPGIIGKVIARRVKWIVVLGG